eukprot:SAG31_NODE_593_length_13721_cov_5.192175_5_plen_347_part_00
MLAALRAFPGRVRLLDPMGHLGAELGADQPAVPLPGLVARPGLVTWRVPDPRLGPDGQYTANTFADPTEVPSELWGNGGKAISLKPSMFAEFHGETRGTAAAASTAALARSLRACLRFLPHDNDAGGFFVAVLQRTAPEPTWAELNATDTTPGCTTATTNDDVASVIPAMSSPTVQKQGTTEAGALEHEPVADDQHQALSLSLLRSKGSRNIPLQGPLHYPGTGGRLSFQLLDMDTRLPVHSSHPVDEITSTSLANTSSLAGPSADLAAIWYNICAFYGLPHQFIGGAAGIQVVGTAKDGELQRLHIVSATVRNMLHLCSTRLPFPKAVFEICVLKISLHGSYENF